MKPYNSEILKAINDTANQVVNISEIMDDMVKNQKERNNNIKNIEKALELIKHVATQTNILGINALIEAAHAGNQGKGFAIIAEEVRKLSTQVSDQEKEIRLAVKDSVQKSQIMTEDLEMLSAKIQQIAANLEEINSEMESII